LKHNYCTVYSKSYLYMGLILYNSLLKYDQDFCLHWMKFSDNAVKLLYLDYINDAKEAMERIRSVYPDYYWDSDKKGKYIRNYFNLETTQMKDTYFFCTVVEIRNIFFLQPFHPF